MGVLFDVLVLRSVVDLVGGGGVMLVDDILLFCGLLLNSDVCCVLIFD